MKQLARTPKQLGAALRRRRRKMGLRQGDIGNLTNLRQATISALENGEPGTRLRTLTHVLAALDLELVVRERSSDSKEMEELF